MENKFPVNIKIADRKYPIKAISTEEENIRKAEKVINERINFHMSDKKIYDKQDLMAMVLIEYVYNHITLNDSSLIFNEKLTSKLNQIENSVNSIL